MATVRPFLMFQGNADEAMNFYVSLFADAEIIDVVRYGPESGIHEGKVMVANFAVAGQTVMCSDSIVQHAFTFTPSFSLFVDCESEELQRQLFAELSDGGMVLMPLDNYGFSRRFGWVNDRFGVSWQINLA